MSTYHNQIRTIIDKYQVIDSSTAQQLLDELLPLQPHWQNCKTLSDYYQLNTSIFYAVGLAYSHLGDYQKSLDYLEPAIKEYNTLSKYGFNRKADFYQVIALNYCHLDKETEAREAFRLMAYNEFQHLNRTTYAVDVYSYRTPSEFVIKDLRESTLSFSSLFDFNDPV